MRKSKEQLKAEVLAVIEQHYREKLSFALGFPRDHWVISYRLKDDLKHLHTEAVTHELTRTRDEFDTDAYYCPYIGMFESTDPILHQKLNDQFMPMRPCPQPAPGVMW